MTKARRKSPVQTISTEPDFCSIELRLRILSRLPFFAGLSPKALEAVNALFVEAGYQPGEVIYTAGSPAERLFVVAEGKVKLLQHAATGNNILLDILAPGEFFGSLAPLKPATYLDSAQAVTPACILSIRSTAFQHVLDQHPELALKTLAILGERLQSANQRVLHLSSLPVERRIACTLLKLGAKLGRRQEEGLLIDVPLSREDLADMTASTPETVSRVMSQFQAGGLIASGRQWVAIVDQAKLQALVGEE